MWQPKFLFYFRFHVRNKSILVLASFLCQFSNISFSDKYGVVGLLNGNAFIYVCVVISKSNHMLFNSIF